MANIPDSSERRPTGFSQVVDAFLLQPGLPFAEILSAERIQRIFAKHGNLFGVGAVYSTAVMVWAFLGQVLRDGKEASCRAAVAHVVTHCIHSGAKPPPSDTGDYCRARAKLSFEALRDITREVAAEVEQRALPAWLFVRKLHAKLIDGSTITMPDTPENQSEYPHPKTQTPGVGLPIARIVTVLSLVTGSIINAAIGPYKGKKTGETSLLRSMLDSFGVGDIAVADRCYCSFMMIAAILARGAHVCVRMHQRRHIDFRRGRRLGKDDNAITWVRPPRPSWMDEATYATIAPTLELRMIRFNIVRPGYRTKSMTIVTTLLDAEEYTKENIAELYGFRWNVELDIRSIKQSLNLGHVRCKSPEMVLREFWTTLLGYNLIRTTAAAALLHEKQPRQISFTSTCQYVLSSWMLISSNQLESSKLADHCRIVLSQIATCEVANRPGRVEPHVLKRRRHHYPLMQKPRAVLKRELRNA